MADLVYKKKYPAKAHLAAAVKYLPDELKSNYILLTSAVAVPLGTSDQYYPFVQESYFYYCSGLASGDSEPSFLLYNIAKAHLTLFIPPPRVGRDIVYLGQRPSSADIARETEADSVQYANDSFPDVLASIGGTCYTLADGALVSALTRARSIKDDYEIQLLQLASDVSSTAHKQVARYISSSHSEQVLDAIFRTTCDTAQPLGAGAGGGLRYAYSPIVAAGRHASTLHYTCPPGVVSSLDDSDLILIDAAASVGSYASDITRTYPRSGTFTPLARKLYAVVLEMQESSIAHLRAGVTMSSVAQKSHAILTRAAVEYQWLNCDIDTATQYGLSKAFLMHGIGHHIGLDVHDVTPVTQSQSTDSTFFSSSSSSDRDDSSMSQFVDLPIIGTRQTSGEVREAVLEVGNVVTVEPGIYFNTAFLQTFHDSEEVGKFFNRDVIAQWSHLGGVRIEDVLLVTQHGSRALSHVPKSIKDIEALCQSRP